jgi:hypothetical protein
VDTAQHSRDVLEGMKLDAARMIIEPEILKEEPEVTIATFAYNS